MLKVFANGALWGLVLAWSLTTAAPAHELAPKANAALALNLNSEALPLAARYTVTIDRRASGHSIEKPKSHTWYFYRDAQRIALLKGGVDEVWFRDAQQRISFERVFHDDERVVDYSTGELATLNVKVDWAALSRFVDPSELAQLKLVSKQGQGQDTRLRLRGDVGRERVTVDWLPAHQLPSRLTRQVQGGGSVQMVLVTSAQIPPPTWPQLGVKSAHYLHIDAADFGDMDYDPVVRKAEALDTRLGWRASHKHD